MTTKLASAAAIAAAIWLAAAPAFAQDAAADGQRLFQRSCGGCHSLEPAANRVGPPLAGVLGRPAGHAEGARYSRAMQSADIVWDEHTLDTFLAAPSRLVPGTTMTVSVPNAGQRAKIIAYLAQAGGSAQRTPSP